MKTLFEYDRSKAVEYAHRWAYSRNPKFYNYELLGGDCTNFVSQCVYAGSGVMSFTKTFGWYYSTPNDKSPAWTGVEYLWNFLNRSDESVGPVGAPCKLEGLQIGDIIQLSFDGVNFGHSMLAVETVSPLSLQNVLITTHTFDADNKRLSSYFFNKIRFLHITGVYKDY